MRHSKLFTMNKPIDEKAEYLKKIQAMAQGVKSKRWCSVHPLSQWSAGYPQCMAGYKLNEKCEEGPKDEDQGQEAMVEYHLEHEQPNDKEEDQDPY